MPTDSDVNSSAELDYMNPFMNAKSLDELRAMEKALYEETWEDGKLIPSMEEYYSHQMELFEEAFSSLYPNDYNFHNKK